MINSNDIENSMLIEMPPDEPIRDEEPDSIDCYHECKKRIPLLDAQQLFQNDTYFSGKAYFFLLAMEDELKNYLVNLATNEQRAYLFISLEQEYMLGICNKDDLKKIMLIGEEGHFIISDVEYCKTCESLIIN